MARATAVDCLRRRPPSSIAVERSLLVAVLPDPVTSIDAARLSRLLVRLPAGQRAVLYLHCFAGLSFREVGRVLRVPTFTAASRYRLALDRLRGWMAP
jgi:DNA-directed RNA polymerase specialized sigma24 family protein